MAELYNEKDLLNLEKSKKNILILVIAFALLFAISLLVFILVSTYKTRVVFSIISSVICVVFAIFAAFFAFKRAYFKRICNEYNTLLKEETKEIEGEVLECSSFLTTLPDKSRCYEVLFKTEGKESIFYLSEIFDREELKSGKCKIYVSFDYVKGYCYED